MGKTTNKKDIELNIVYRNIKELKPYKKNAKKHPKEQVERIANSINTLFSVMSERRERLKLSSEEVKIIHSGQIALACLTDRMADISGMNEKVQKIEEKVHEVSKEEAENFLDFLKEILG